MGRTMQGEIKLAADVARHPQSVARSLTEPRPWVTSIPMSRPVLPRAAAVAVLALAVTTGAAIATPHHPPSDWHSVKCDRYTRAWSAALARFGTRGLGAAFLASHDAFLKSNCTTRADVCPRAPEEFKLANIMVVLSMNAGTASTFPPFACRRD